ALTTLRFLVLITLTLLIFFVLVIAFVLVVFILLIISLILILLVVFLVLIIVFLILFVLIVLLFILIFLVVLILIFISRRRIFIQHIFGYRKIISRLLIIRIVSQSIFVGLNGSLIVFFFHQHIAEVVIDFMLFGFVCSFF